MRFVAFYDSGCMTYFPIIILHLLGVLIHLHQNCYSCFLLLKKKMSAWFLVSCWVGVWVTTSVSLAVFWVVFEPHFNHKKLLLQPFWKLNRHFGMAVHCTFLHYRPKVMFRSSKFVPLWKFLISTGVALDSCREAPENPNDLKITRLFAYQVTFGWEK